VKASQASESHERSRQIRHRCAELNDSLWKPPKWEMMRIHHEKHAIICVVGKTATVSWKRVLLRLTGKPAAIRLASQSRSAILSHASRYFGNMRDIHASQRDAVLNRTYKIMLLRDPLVRLISGYRERMLKQNQQDFVKEQTVVKRMFRPNVSPRSEIQYVTRCLQLQFASHSTVVRPRYNIQRPKLRSGCCIVEYIRK